MLLASMLLIFILLVAWYTCNSGILGQLHTFETRHFLEAEGVFDYEYLFYSKALPLGHPYAQNFHKIEPTKEGLYIGRPPFLKLISKNILIPWTQIELNKAHEMNPKLCALYVPKLGIWLGIKKQHQSKIEYYKLGTLNRQQ